MYLLSSIILLASVLAMLVAGLAGQHQLVQMAAAAGAGLMLLVIAAGPDERQRARR